MRYPEFFQVATDFEPFRFQVRYAEGPPPPLLEVPTGLGKTETTVLPFLHGTVFAPGSTPRRLVYVLPMRSLVEQTKARLDGWCDRLEAKGVEGLPKVATLLGGDVDDTWLETPDERWVLIGTQDMILSRALNRGYAASPFLWPMSFAFLNNDAHWILDEVQLQGVGVRTAAQLQGLRAKLGTFGTTRTTFVSATLEPAWVHTVDHSLGTQTAFRLSEAERGEPEIAKRLAAVKTVRRLSAKAGSNDVAAEIAALHRPGSLTLVVVNQVGRAQALVRALRRVVDPAIVELLHGRFRPLDRKEIAERALGSVDQNGPGRLVVSTQVIEAGVDVDARTLVSELAPWASIVQRLGRCNRRGDHDDARFAWIDLDEAKEGAPYERDELVRARDLLLVREGANMAPRDLPHVDLPLTANATLRRVDLLDLFDTAPGISGNDVDVGRFIREADELNVSVFWRDAPPHGGDDRPRRDELCPAPLSGMKSLMERLRRQQRGNAVRIRAPLADGDDDVWRVATAGDVRRGAVFWIAADAGGYDPAEGFESEAKQRVAPVDVMGMRKGLTLPEETERLGGDRGTFINTRVRLRTHADDARNCARQLVGALDSLLDPQLAELVVRAALWHDTGKAHQVFQATMERTGLPADGGPWAKSEKAGQHKRRHFRHELVSLLAWLREHDGGRDDDLVAYLVAAHHGKLRVFAYPYPGETSEERRTILGVMQGDELPAVEVDDDERSPAFNVDLALFDVGSANGSATWADRVLAMRDDAKLGPFRLTFLESLVRVADWRASELRRASPEVFA